VASHGGLLTLFKIVIASAAKQSSLAPSELDCFAALAMTRMVGSCRSVFSLDYVIERAGELLACGNSSAEGVLAAGVR
jgi:hypothetical protein